MEGQSLLEVLATIPDPRKARGVRHPLPAVLSLAVVAMLAGNKSLEAIAQFGRDRGHAFAHALGFRRGKTPAKSTFSEIFRAVDVVAFETAINHWLQSRVLAGWQHLALDGKTLKGAADGEAPAVHLLAAFVPQAAAVIAQMRVDAKTNEHKAALQMLGVLPLSGKIVTGDAMFTHRDTACEVRAGGGDYILIVKDNQPELKKQIQEALYPPEEMEACVRLEIEKQEQTAKTVDKGHGRVEIRRLTSTTLLNDYLDWPDVGQVFELERVRVLADKTEVEVVYGISSLSREQATAMQMLGHVRQHWAIENQLHYVRDETLGEDRCRVRKGGSAQVLAALRNVVVHLLGQVNAPSKAAATRRLSAHPEEALPLLLD
jgi:predicted transposase YbfD/YdcC